MGTKHCSWIPELKLLSEKQTHMFFFWGAYSFSSGNSTRVRAVDFLRWVLCGTGEQKEQEPAWNKRLASCTHLMQKHPEMCISEVWLRIWLEQDLNCIQAFLFKVRFLKYDLHANGRLPSHCQHHLAAWERWSNAEYSPAWFGQDGC